jgi:hypothetical protein
MYDTIKQINEEITKLKKEIRKLRRKEDRDIDNGTYNMEEYLLQAKYLSGKLHGLMDVLRIVECNDH